jgi:hypothetical protein
VATKKDANPAADEQAGALATTEQGGALALGGGDLDFEADAGQGAQNIGKDDMALPFLVILQDLSPQTKKSKGEYILGAAPGMFLNTVTSTVYKGDPGILFIPALYQRTVIEWVPKDAGGGFVADHGLARGTELLKQASRGDKGYVLANGNQLVETAYHFGLIVDGEWDGDTFKGTGEAQQVLYTAKSSGLKVSRKWNTLTQGVKLQGRNGPFTPAMAYMSYRLKTKEVSNDKGTWAELVVEPYLPTPQLTGGASLYKMAVSFAKVMAFAPLPVDQSGVVEGAEAVSEVGNHF